MIVHLQGGIAFMKFLSEIISVLSSLSAVAMGIFAFFTYKLTRKLSYQEKQMIDLQKEFNDFTKKSFEQDRQPLIEVIGSQTSDDDIFAFYYSKGIGTNVTDNIDILKKKDDGAGTPPYLRDKDIQINDIIYKANLEEIELQDVTDYTRNKQETVFYQAPLFRSEKIDTFGGSIVLNLAQPTNRFCVIKNQTSIKLHNFGAAIKSIYIKKVYISYNSGKKPFFLGKDNDEPVILNTADNTSIPFILRTGESKYIHITELTNNLDGSLFNMAHLDGTKDASEIEYSSESFHFNKINFLFTAKSVFGNDYEFHTTWTKGGGNRMAFQTYLLSDYEKELTNDKWYDN